MEQRTIAAISTPVGAGGIAVIRISGADAIRIADMVFAGKPRFLMQIATPFITGILSIKMKMLLTRCSFL